jgi:phytoene dehydrogenase-like protein
LSAAAHCGSPAAKTTNEAAPVIAHAGEHDVVVVGSGPNGLAAAITCADAGLSVHVVEAQQQPGGGCRTVELDLGVPLRHDLCSAVHPMAMASPFFQSVKLAERVAFGQPDIAYAHPLDGGRAGIAYRDLHRTVVELEDQGTGEGRLFGRMIEPLVGGVDAVKALGLSDVRSVPAEVLRPSGLLGTAAMGVGMVQLGTPLWERLTDAPVAGALLTGVGAHANTAIPSLAGAVTGLLLGTLAHTHGWPIPVGGSQAITDHLCAELLVRGGTITCGTSIDDSSQLPPARAYLFDTNAWTLDRVFGDLLPKRYRRALRRFRPGNGVAKVDFALNGPVPWTDDRIMAAGTVHVGGDRHQMARAEAETTAGRHSATPMMLVSQPTVVDDSRRGAGGALPLWSYAHVPNGSTLDVTETAIAQIERFAPGFRDVIIGSRCIPAAEMSQHNANYTGGDIAAGLVSMYRIAARPVPRWDTYRTPLPGVYLCSGSTAPGPGVHGMCGVHAATRVLKQQFGISRAHDVPTVKGR